MAVKGLQVRIPWKVHAKQRPRQGRGHTYTPKPTKDAEKVIADNFRELCAEHIPFDGPIIVRCELTDDEIILDVRPTGEHANRKLRGDVDNYAKTVLDALNGIAWVDDKQIRRLDVVKL